MVPKLAISASALTAIPNKKLPFGFLAVDSSRAISMQSSDSLLVFATQSVRAYWKEGAKSNHYDIYIKKQETVFL